MNPAKVSSDSTDNVAEPFRTGECQAESVCALSGKDDTELVALAIARPHEGRYFLALYCRHRGLVHSLLKPEKTPTEVTSLEATVWSQVYADLRQFDIREDRFVSWLVTLVAQILTRISDETTLYTRSGVIPVSLVPFLRRALDEIPQPQRLLLILRETMDLSLPEILQILDKEGYTLMEEELLNLLERAHRQILGSLPQDIYAIYFEEKSDLNSEHHTP